jgi:hypothetical protein
VHREEHPADDPDLRLALTEGRARQLMHPTRHTALRGIVQATIPVSDLARRARQT